MKTKKMCTLLLLSALFSSQLLSCNRTNQGSQSYDSSNSSTSISLPHSTSQNTDRSYSIETDIKSVYSIGEVIDFSNSYLIIKSGETEVERVSFLDSSFQIDGVDTSTEGNKRITIRYLDYTTTISYKVETHYVTFKLNGGTLNGSSEDVKAALSNNYLDISSYRPTKNDEEGNALVFSGWYYDAELKNRATYQLDTDFYNEQSVTLYAKFGVDHSDLFNYSINEKEHTCSIVSLNFDNLFNFLFETELIIPKEIDGYPVTEIGPNIFVSYQAELDDPSDPFNDPYFDYSTMLYFETVSFEEGSQVKKIGANAFKNLSSLKNLNLPDSLNEIGEYAFSNCAIENLTIPAGVQKIEKQAFSYNVSLNSVSFAKGSNLKVIGEETFSMCSKLSSVTLPDKLEEIKTGAFASCNDIETLFLPSSVSLVSPGSFKLMQSLKSIQVDENNKFYISVDGNLYSKDKKKLLRYCFGNNEVSFAVPSYVKSIGDNAFDVFSTYTCLSNLILPDSLTYIGKEAFSGCSFNLKLPSSLNSFALGAFVGFKGSKIEVDSANLKYVAKDGVLYSKDFTKLFACPCNVGISNFVLDDRVQVISEYAFNNVDTILTFTIGENSQIQEFRKGSLLLTTCSDLNYFDYQPSTIPTFYLNSFYNGEVPLNSYLFLLFKSEDVKKAFASVLPNSSMTSLTQNYSYNFELLTHAQLVDDIKNQMANAGYTDLQYYTDTSHLYLFGNDFSIYKFRNLMNKIEAVYADSLADESTLGYFSLFDKYLYSSFLTNYSLSQAITSLSVRYYNLLQNHYRLMPSSNKQSIKKYLDEISTAFAFTEDTDIVSEIYSEILTFKVDENTFDKVKYDALCDKVEENHILDRAIPSYVYDKLLMLQISDGIYQVLNFKEMTQDNVLAIYQILHYSSDEDSFGLIDKINAYLTTENRKKRVYKYNEFESFLTRYEAEDGILRQEIIKIEKGLKDYQFDKNKVSEASNYFNTTISFLGNNFMYELNMDSQNGDFDYLKKYYILALEINFQVMVSNSVYSVSDENIENYLGLKNNIDRTVIYMLQYLNANSTEEITELDEETKASIIGYSSYEEYSSTWETYLSGKITSIKDTISSFELTDENLSSDSFDKLNQAMDEFGSYIADYLEADDLTSYYTIYASYLIHQMFIKFPEINNDNLMEFKKYYYGYYDFDKGEKVVGFMDVLDPILAKADSANVKDFEKYTQAIMILQ